MFQLESKQITYDSSVCYVIRSEVWHGNVRIIGIPSVYHVTRLSTQHHKIHVEKQISSNA